MALAPEHAAYRGEAATAAIEALRLAEARTDLDAALAQSGDDYVALAAAGLLALRQGDAEAARTALLKALEDHRWTLVSAINAQGQRLGAVLLRAGAVVGDAAIEAASRSLWLRGTAP